MNKMLKTAGIAAGVLAAGMTALGRYSFEATCRRKKKHASSGESTDPVRQKHNAAKNELLKEPYQEVSVTSEDGLKLYGKYYPNPDAERAVLCVHGYLGTAEGNFGTVWQLLKDSCSLLLIDERASGKSEGTYITFGAKEKKDLLIWARKLTELTEGKLPVYLFGISMGSAAVMMTADMDLPPQVKGLIADCGYTCMKQIVSEYLKDRYHLPAFPVTDLIALFCRTRGHFRMSEADARKALEKADRPVLFLHGTGDDFVRVRHTEINAEACRSPHRTVYFEGAGHGDSAVSDPEKYLRALEAFFADCEKSV